MVLGLTLAISTTTNRFLSTHPGHLSDQMKERDRFTSLVVTLEMISQVYNSVVELEVQTEPSERVS